MNHNFLDFEKPIAELEDKLRKQEEISTNLKIALQEKRAKDRTAVVQPIISVLALIWELIKK